MTVQEMSDSATLPLGLAMDFPCALDTAAELELDTDSPGTAAPLELDDVSAGLA